MLLPGLGNVRKGVYMRNNRPKSNGIIEIIDEKQGLDDNSWNCMDFHLFSFKEEDKSWEASHARFLAAKSGNCPYKDICPRYASTIAKRKKQPYQLTLF